MWTFGPICSSPIAALRSIPASESAFTRFIDSTDASCILIEINAVLRASDYIGSSTPQPIASRPLSDQAGTSQTLGEYTFLFSNRKWIGRPQDEYKPNKAAIPRIAQSADIQRVIPLEPESSRRGDVTLGGLELVNTDGGLDDFISNYSIADRTISVYYGPANGDFKAFKLIGQAFGDRFENTLDKVRVRIKSTADYLDKPLYGGRYTGAGGLGGDPEIKDTIRPILFGDCFNVTPVLINQENWVYQVHDSPILAVNAVRERGADFINDGNAATYLQLINATVASGHYLTCTSLGLFRAGFSGEPAGPVTCDVHGDVDATGYTDKTGEILLRIAQRRAGLGSEFIQANTFANLPTSAIGYYTGQEEKTCADAFNDLLSGVNGWYGSERTKLLKVGSFREPNGQPYARTLDKNSALELEELVIEQPPRYQQSVKYAKNWTPMDSADVTTDDGIITSTTRTALLKEGESVTLNSLAVRQRHRDAIIGEAIQSYFKTIDPANEVCSRVMGLFQETRRRFRQTVPRVGYVINLQDFIRVENPRLGLASGKTCLVLGTKDDGKDDKVELILWG